MKTKLLLGLLLASAGLSAQTTHHIDWFMGVTNASASITIEQGDTVEWEWTDSLPHTVTSNAGGAETFSSGSITGNGETFTHTFANIGATTYKCNVHAMMQGTITVDAVAGVRDTSKITFDAFPNPVVDILTITSDSVIDRIEMYDINGRQIMNSKSGNQTSKIYMSGFTSGTYFVKVVAGGGSKTVSVVKN